MYNCFNERVKNVTEDYNEIEQVELAIQAAERMVGQATMSMDATQLQNATQALEEAKQRLEEAKIVNLNHDQWEYSNSRLNRLSHQVENAKD
ncbi:DUF2564 family protein [Bacillus sp. A301a_S52]|nr:DUF2564 family protein [Bacillus sp. A301a_S52]